MCFWPIPILVSMHIWHFHCKLVVILNLQQLYTLLNCQDQESSQGGLGQALTLSVYHNKNKVLNIMVFLLRALCQGQGHKVG